jgi:hypothetical protein
MDEFITRAEHDEYARRMDDEHKRQNHRLCELEETVRQIGDLTISVKEMAISMRSMLDEQKAQGKRIGALESRDGEQWRKTVSRVVDVAVGILVGYIFKLIGIF